MRDRAEPDSPGDHPSAAGHEDIRHEEAGEGAGPEDQAEGQEAPGAELGQPGHFTIVSPEIDKEVVRALVALEPGGSLDTALAEAGVSHDEYYELCQSPDFINQIYNECIARHLVPEFGPVMKHLATLTLEAKSPGAMRTYFEILGKLNVQQGDNHLHLHGRSDEELAVLTERITRKAKKALGK